MRIANRSQAFEWYHFQWPWTTLSDLVTFLTTRHGLSAAAELLLLLQSCGSVRSYSTRARWLGVVYCYDVLLRTSVYSLLVRRSPCCGCRKTDLQPRPSKTGHWTFIVARFHAGVHIVSRDCFVHVTRVIVSRDCRIHRVVYRCFNTRITARSRIAECRRREIKWKRNLS